MKQIIQLKYDWSKYSIGWEPNQTNWNQKKAQSNKAQTVNACLKPKKMYSVPKNTLSPSQSLDRKKGRRWPKTPATKTNQNSLEKPPPMLLEPERRKDTSEIRQWRHQDRNRGFVLTGENPMGRFEREQQTMAPESEKNANQGLETTQPPTTGNQHVEQEDEGNALELFPQLWYHDQKGPTIWDNFCKKISFIVFSILCVCVVI